MSAPLDEAALYHEGIELFNHQEWFEAHEVWEDIWHMASGERKRFYQGLIQCAVALEHLRRGNPRGVRNVWTTAQTKFVGIPAQYLGLRVPEFLEQMRQALTPTLSLPDSAFVPGQPPRQDLEVPAERVPHITLMNDPFSDR